MADQPQDLVLHLLRGLRADMAEARENLQGASIRFGPMLRPTS
jgi:hypothetical protein